MRTTPALLLAAAVWAGCAWPAPSWSAPVALGLLALALPVAVRGHGRAALALALIAMVALGAGLAGGRRALALRSPVAAAAAEGAVVELRGRVATEPRRTAFGDWSIMRVSAVAGRSTSARVLVRDAGADLGVGQTLTATARFGPPPDGTFGRYLRDAGVVATADPVARVSLGPAPGPVAMTTDLRRRTLRVFAATLPQPHAALLGGVVFGAREGLPDDALAAAGLSHLVVVSGRHVAVLLAGVLVLTAAGGVGVRGRSQVGLVAVWWFVILTRWEPSILRAAVMATVALVGVLCGRARDPVHTLAMTVLVLLLIDPLLARQLGFVLSVLATGGVMAALRAVPSRRPLAVALLATAGAQITTAPVVVAMDGAVPLAALPANLIAGPAAAAAQVLGLVTAALIALHLPGAVLVTRLAEMPLAVMWWAATAFTGLPALTAHQVVAVLCAPLVVALAGRSRAAIVATAAIALLVTAAVLRLPPPAPEDLRLTAVDVGQGDGLLVESPGGRNGARMVVDGGPKPTDLAQALAARRIRAVDAVVLTHGDHDHSGGLAAVLRRVDAAALLVPAGAGRAPHALSDSAVAALEVARARGIRVIGVHAGMRFSLGASAVEVLAPPRHLPPGGEPNSGSVVLRVTGAHGSMLLTGDTDATMQQTLLGRPDRLRADVLKVPHHGGATNAPGFLDAVHATVAVVSAGRDNTYGHPHPDTLADLAPVPVWRTDRDGAVTVSLTATGPMITTQRGR